MSKYDEGYAIGLALTEFAAIEEELGNLTLYYPQGPRLAVEFVIS